MILIYNFFFIENLTKRCMPDGHWEDPDGTNPMGKTDFKQCYLSDMPDPRKAYIYRIVSHVEFVGLVLSLICIFVSLFIFTYHK